MMLGRRMQLSGLTVVLLAAAAAPTLADTGFYVGAMAGESLFHEDRSDADAAVIDAFNVNGFAVLNASSTLDKTDVAFGGLVGYQFTPSLAAEAAYIDLGKLSYKSSGTVTNNGFTTFPATANLTAKAKGPTLSALGILPLSPAWEVYGRAGLFFSKVTLTADISVSDVGGHDSVSANSVDPLIGVGAAWHVADRVTLRAEYTRFVNVGDKDKTGEINIDLFNLGVTYSFRY
jgi:opacity protein-like surface antigen